jgi:hypothetical protein
MPTAPPVPDGAAIVARVVAHLRKDPERYAHERSPHPRAASLALTDQSPAPPSLRAWAAFDDHYPWYLASRRSPQIVADRRGKVLAQPMPKLLRRVCLDAIRDEIEGDDETVAYLKERIRELSVELPGFGVYLEPDEQPDRVLWLPPGGEATVIWYEDDAFERREPFARYVADLFEVDVD